MKNFVWLVVVALVFVLVSDVEARGFRRRSRSNYSTTSTVNYSFSGDAQAVCEQKAELQASLCSMFHPGGSFGGGSAEGVGCAGDPDTALSVCCYSNSGRTLLGQAVRRGANGMWYACRIFR